MTTQCLHDEEKLKFLSNLGFIYSSAYVKMINNKKKTICCEKWATQTCSSNPPKYNTVFVITGKISNCFVVDIDDSSIDEAAILMNLCEETCNLICKTRKGYHYYFKYDTDICKTSSYQSLGFDIRSDSGIIYAPPGYYMDENKNKYTYEFIKVPEDCYDINTISFEAKEFLLNLINESNGEDQIKNDNVNNKNKVKNNNVVNKDPVTNENIELEPNKINEDIKTIPNENNNSRKKICVDKNKWSISNYANKLLLNNDKYANDLFNSVIDIVNNLDVDRNNNYNKWVSLGMMLFKFDDFGIDLWKQFSQLYEKYNEAEIDDKLPTFNSDSGFSYWSLLFWLKKDNSVYYANFIKKYSNLINHLNGKSFSDNDLEINTLKKYISFKDEGLALIFKENVINSIVSCKSETGNTYTYYRYDDKLKLWIYLCASDLISIFMINMKHYINPLIIYYKNLIKDAIFNKLDQKIIQKYKNKLKKYKNLPQIYKCSSANSMIGMISYVLNYPNFINLLDSNNDVIPIDKGIVDLRDGSYRVRTCNDYFTFQIDVPWKGIDYPTPNIDLFFNNIMLGDIDMIKYLQKVLGYSITGHTSAHKMFIFWGNGANGKSVLQDLLASIFKQFFKQIDSDVVIQNGNKKNTGAASPHLMQLKGTRLAFVDESERNASLNENNVKTLTGSKNVNARPLFGEYINFNTTFKLFLLTNFKPKIDPSDSMNRRLVLIPFLAQFKKPMEFDPNNPTHFKLIKGYEIYLQKFKDEFVSWIVKGSVNYFNSDLDDVPAKVFNATKKYVTDNDQLQELIDNKYMIDPTGFVSSSELLEIFNRTFSTKINHNTFSEMMLCKGFSHGRRSGSRGYFGLSPKISNIFNQHDDAPNSY